MCPILMATKPSNMLFSLSTFVVCLLGGLEEVGIFRLPGKASQIQALRELYDSGSQQDFPASEDVHNVASLLKLYLRELPEPVIPYIYYTSYRQALEGVGMSVCVGPVCL